MKLKNYNTNSITLIRAILALGFLLTLLFNDINDLFPKEQIEKIRNHPSDIMFLNIFTWFESVTIPYYISVITLIVVITGLYPRITSFLHAIITFSVFNSMIIIEGGDQVSLVICILLIPICIIDNRLNGWKSNESHLSKPAFLLINSNYANLFIKIQVALIYFNASIAKMYAPEWPNGTAVYYWFNDNVFGATTFFKSVFGFLFENNFTVTFINWGVIFLELYIAIVIFLPKRNKSLAFLLGLIFHFAIILFHGLPTFFLAMTATLMLYIWDLDKDIKENVAIIRTNLHQICNVKKLAYEYL